MGIRVVPTVRIEPRYVTLSQAGQYFGGLTAEAVRHMVRNGKLPCSKLGGRIFIAVRDIERVMEQTQLRAV